MYIYKILHSIVVSTFEEKGSEVEVENYRCIRLTNVFYKFMKSLVRKNLLILLLLMY